MSGAISASTVFTAVGAAASLLSATGALGGKGGSQPAPAAPAPIAPAPVVEKPTTMPTPNDASAKAARQASIAEQMRRRGRASTILTDVTQSDTLG